MLFRSACEGLEYMGVELDDDKNAKCPRGKIADISKESSKVRILVIPTNEELVIAKETKRVAKI